MAITTLGSGAFLAIAMAWFMVRKEASIEADLYLGTAALLAAGALAWGALLGDFNTVHLFFAGIAVFATPARPLPSGRSGCACARPAIARLAVAVLVLCGTNLSSVSPSASSESRASDRRD